MKDFLYRWDSFKVLQHSILLQSNVTCSQRNTPPFPPKYPKVSVYRYLYTLIANPDRNVYVRIQHFKIPRFAQDSSGECWSQAFKNLKNWILRRDLRPPVFQKRTVLLFFINSFGKLQSVKLKNSKTVLFWKTGGPRSLLRIQFFSFSVSGPRSLLRIKFFQFFNFSSSWPLTGPKIKPLKLYLKIV